MIRIQDTNRKNRTFFSPYDEASQTPMTPSTALWCNHVQEEICGFIESQRMQLTGETHQFISALNFVFETAPVFYEGELRQEAKPGIKLSQGQTVSFMVGLELDPQLSESHLGDLYLTPELLSILRAPLPPYFSDQTRLVHLSPDLQKTLSLIYLKLHRPIYRVHTNLEEKKSPILIEHDLLLSPDRVNYTREIEAISPSLQTLYTDHEGLYQQTLSFPLQFGFTDDGELQVRFNDAVFGPFLRGFIRLFNLRTGDTLSSFSVFR